MGVAGPPGPIYGTNVLIQRVFRGPNLGLEKGRGCGAPHPGLWLYQIERASTTAGLPVQVLTMEDWR